MTGEIICIVCGMLSGWMMSHLFYKNADLLDKIEGALGIFGLCVTIYYMAVGLS